MACLIYSDMSVPLGWFNVVSVRYVGFSNIYIHVSN